MPASTFAADPPRLSGMAFKEAWDCSYPPAVESTDVLRINYDVHTVGRDGLYLVEELSHSGIASPWRTGSRRRKWRCIHSNGSIRSSKTSNSSGCFAMWTRCRRWSMRWPWFPMNWNPG